MALGVATGWATEMGAPNAATLDRMATTLERGGSVSLSAARRELGTWVRDTLSDPGAPRKARDWAETLSEALHLRAT